MCGVGSIIGGLFSNLPFIIAPPTAISIFLSIFLQQKKLDTSVGNQAVVASGIGLIFLGYRPLSRFLSRVSVALFALFVLLIIVVVAVLLVDSLFNSSWNSNWNWFINCISWCN